MMVSSFKTSPRRRESLFALLATQSLPGRDPDCACPSSLTLTARVLPPFTCSVLSFSRGSGAFARALLKREQRSPVSGSDFGPPQRCSLDEYARSTFADAPRLRESSRYSTDGFHKDEATASLPRVPPLVLSLRCHASCHHLGLFDISRVDHGFTKSRRSTR